eukprot:Sspe_Gene.105345::Locus_82386_Transcript_1_1_Confidence_1.000_Length_1712::g.105345::m.105345
MMNDVTPNLIRSVGPRIIRHAPPTAARVTVVQSAKSLHRSRSAPAQGDKPKASKGTPDTPRTPASHAPASAVRGGSYHRARSVPVFTPREKGTPAGPAKTATPVTTSKLRPSPRPSTPPQSRPRPPSPVRPATPPQQHGGLRAPPFTPTRSLFSARSEASSDDPSSASTQSVPRHSHRDCLPSFLQAYEESQDERRRLLTTSVTWVSERAQLESTISELRGKIEGLQAREAQLHADHALALERERREKDRYLKQATELKGRQNETQARLAEALQRIRSLQNDLSAKDAVIAERTAEVAELKEKLRTRGRVATSPPPAPPQREVESIALPASTGGVGSLYHSRAPPTRETNRYPTPKRREPIQELLEAEEDVKNGKVREGTRIRFCAAVDYKEPPSPASSCGTASPARGYSTQQTAPVMDEELSRDLREMFDEYDVEHRGVLSRDRVREGWNRMEVTFQLPHKECPLGSVGDEITFSQFASIMVELTHRLATELPIG